VVDVPLIAWEFAALLTRAEQAENQLAFTLVDRDTVKVELARVVAERDALRAAIGALEQGMRDALAGGIAGKPGECAADYGRVADRLAVLREGRQG
jgi:hypothetical protein